MAYRKESYKYYEEMNFMAPGELTKKEVIDAFKVLETYKKEQDPFFRLWIYLTG